MKDLSSISSEVNELIAAYLLGIIDHGGMKRLIAWIHLSEDNKQLFNQFNDIWQSAASEKGFEKTDLQKQWLDVLSKIRQKQKPVSRKMDTPGFYDTLKRILGVAAAILMIFGAGMFVQNHRKSYVEEFPAEYVEMTAPIGSRAHVVLTDGSKVWLNAGTKLRYSTRFGKKDRNIDLTGEAYFSVAKRADLPFVIQAADIKITALGTAFNVKAYAEEGQVETSLESGSVKIERVGKTDGIPDQPIILQPNEKVALLAYVSKSQEKDNKKEVVSTLETQTPPTTIVPGVVVEKIEDMRVSTSWKDSNWVIRSESMKSLAVKLSRRYDVNFVFRDEDLEKYKFSTTLRDETLEQVLNMIQFSAPIKYKIQEKTVFLSFNPKYKKTFEGNIQ